MAKDPAFLFYYADAASDVSHMNRMERGCYFDIVQSQKKFGRLNIEQIQKILSRDFETCWPALELILTKKDGTYSIEWLEESIEKRAKFSESRSKNRNSTTHDEHMSNMCETHEQHMVNEIVIVNTIEEEAEIEKSEIPKKSKSEKMFSPESREILRQFNQITGHTYDIDNPGHLKIIDARLSKKAIRDDMIDVIVLKQKEWSGDEKMHRYIRPATLFGERYDQYLEEVRMIKSGKTKILSNSSKKENEYDQMRAKIDAALEAQQRGKVVSFTGT